MVYCRQRSNLGPGLTNRGYYLAVRADDGWRTSYLATDGAMCGGHATVSVHYRPSRVEIHPPRIAVFVDDRGDPRGGAPSSCFTFTSEGGLVRGCETSRGP